MLSFLTLVSLTVIMIISGAILNCLMKTEKSKKNGLISMGMNLFLQMILEMKSDILINSWKKRKILTFIGLLFPCGELQSTTDVMVRKLESLDTKQLQLNERYETEFQGETDRFGNEYVTFTPEKTGSYYIIKEELESPGDEFVGTQVVSSSR